MRGNSLKVFKQVILRNQKAIKPRKAVKRFDFPVQNKNAYSTRSANLEHSSLPNEFTRGLVWQGSNGNSLVWKNII